MLGTSSLSWGASARAIGQSPPGPCLPSGWTLSRESDSKYLDKPQRSADLWLPGRQEPYILMNFVERLSWEFCLCLGRLCCLRSKASDWLFLLLCFLPFLLWFIRGFATDINSVQDRSLKITALAVFPFTWLWFFGTWSMLNFSSALLGLRTVNLALIWEAHFLLQSASVHLYSVPTDGSCSQVGENIQPLLLCMLKSEKPLQFQARCPHCRVSEQLLISQWSCELIHGPCPS